MNKHCRCYGSIGVFQTSGEGSTPSHCIYTTAHVVAASAYSSDKAKV